MNPRPTVRRWDVPDMADAAPRPLQTVIAPLTAAAPVLAAPVLAAPAFSTPVFTGDDIAEARAQGQRDAVQVAERSASERTARALEQIAGELDRAAEATADTARRTSVALAEVVVRVFAAAFPRLEARLGPAEVEAFAGMLLGGLSREEAVLVRVAPEGQGALQAPLAALPEVARARIRIESDATLGPADLRVAWEDGSASRDAVAIRAAVMEVLGTLVPEAADQGGEA